MKQLRSRKSSSNAFKVLAFFGLVLGITVLAILHYQKIAPAIVKTSNAKQKEGMVAKTSMIQTQDSPLPAVQPVSLQSPSVAPISVKSPDVELTPEGIYTIKFEPIHLSFTGSLATIPTDISTERGNDTIGTYSEVKFDYSDQTGRAGSIKAYDNGNSAIFSESFAKPQGSGVPFPAFSTYPHLPFHIGYNGMFARQQFNAKSSSGPLIFYDQDGTTFIMSAASNFLNAETRISKGDVLVSGPIGNTLQDTANYTTQTILVAGKGIGSTISTWGNDLTSLGHKARPSNESDVLLKYLSYWTDSGSSYYYNYDQSLGSYPATLLAIKNEYDQKGVPLKSLQLDSWWYGPKGSDKGILSYTADPAIWTPDSSSTPASKALLDFQQQLGLPVIVHSRWISPQSPYREQFKMSGGVSIDPRYWTDIMSYLKQTKAIVYEQDWMDRNAVAKNPTDENTFLDEMANAAKNFGIDLQYCMELPSQVLQSTLYSNLTTMRVSDDHFEQKHWDNELWSSQLAKAVGVWPWVDVFMSNERNNVLLADLSAGPVGPGDAIGTVNADNLQHVIRADSEIVKPDVPATPVDAVYVERAEGKLNTPMIASTYTDFGNSRAVYIAAYPHSDGETQVVTFKPADLGLSGSVYVYDYFNNNGVVTSAAKPYTDHIANLTYYIVVPIDKGGIGLLGDLDKYVSLGKSRVSQLTDTGTAEKITLDYASNESRIVLSGYASHSPTITAISGSIENLSYNMNTHLFSVAVTASTNYSSTLIIK